MTSLLSSLFPSGVSLLDILAIAVALFIAWIIVSIPAWIAGKLVTRGKATFGQAMLATLLGPIVYVIALVVLDLLLGGVFGSIGYIVAFVLAFVAWVWVYKSIFNTGWLGGLAIAILAIIVFIVLLIIIGILLVGIMPNLLPSTLTQL
jgi:hypothetical protein